MSTQTFKPSTAGTIVAGTVGAAIGATASVVLSDKKNREKISGFIQNASDKMEVARGKIENLADKAGSRIEDVGANQKGALKRVESKVKQAVHKK